MKISNVKEFCQAVADGKHIERRQIQTTEWLPFLFDVNSIFLDFKTYEYRIKPKTVKYRLYLYKQIDGKFCVDAISSNESEKFAENLNGFVRWLVDWQEVDVE